MIRVLVRRFHFAAVSSLSLASIRFATKSPASSQRDADPAVAIADSP
jgi:hypothetical protein